MSSVNYPDAYLFNDFLSQLFFRYKLKLRDWYKMLRMLRNNFDGFSEYITNSFVKMAIKKRHMDFDEKYSSYFGDY